MLDILEKVHKARYTAQEARGEATDRHKCKGAELETRHSSDTILAVWTG